MQQSGVVSGGKGKSGGKGSNGGKGKGKNQRANSFGRGDSGKGMKLTSNEFSTPSGFSQQALYDTTQSFQQIYNPQIAVQAQAAVLAQQAAMFQQPYQVDPSMYQQPYQRQEQGGFPNAMAFAANPLWTTFYTTEGVPYYYNSQTGLTQWEKPNELESNGVMGMSPVRRNNGSSTFGKNGPPGCNVFVFHCPNEWTDDDLVRRFSKFGDIVSAKIMVELDTGRSRGYGFVSFYDDAAAQHAISEMNGLKVLGKRLKVEIKRDAAETRGRKGKGKGKQQQAQPQAQDLL